ncbi:uncharacterized protein LOC126894057 isoform X1 [Daktulosphaira vitifoliae]|uniref:uncharacterized protein LOC126894057 isoform X1 n=1 Tax=Daktulosphaira vitifoliae TaxID=58002 RepID=UPI0021AA9E27|nr:uncharacterized protein LOC126894057 isoform X1 [Daktulosphaira vitifoliae]
MELNIFILISIVVFVLNPTEGVQPKRKYNQHYKNYIKTVVAHIHSQIGSYQMQNLKLKQSLNYPDLEENNISNDFSCNYRYTISVLNFKYTEILKKFLYYINIIIDKCKQSHERNLSENFISCVSLLETEVKNSKSMFEYLHNAMKFISYIDIRFLFHEGLAPHPIIDEIDFFQQFVKKLETTYFVDINILPNLEDSKTKYENLKQFYEDALEILNDLFQNSQIIDISDLNTDLKENQIKECSIDSNINIDDCSNENNFANVYSMCSELNSFYNETIEIWYKNIGFEKLLNPETPDFTPPIDPEIRQDDSINALNILRLETGWKSMNHINIVYYKKYYDVDYIIKEKINDINFRIKKEHVVQLLRCKYTEVLKNYQTLLSAILFICKKDSIDHQNKCLIQLFKSFNKSKKMLKGLYNALITLNKSSIWTFKINSLSSLHRIFEWISYSLNLLKKNNYFQIDFVDQNDNEKINEIIQSLLHIFQDYLDIIYYKITNCNTSRFDTWCHFTKNLFFDRKNIIKYFRNSVNTLNDPNTTRKIQTYQIACHFFDNFCENIYNNCYKNLGFEKINCHDTNIDERLKPFIVD